MRKPLVHIWADESCLGVQFTDRDSPGGAGGLVELWRRGAWLRRDYWLSEPATTNNRMALRSAITGLRLLRTPCRVIFTSDSQYLIHGIRDWMPGWKARGWKRRTGTITNLDLWRELEEIVPVDAGPDQPLHEVRWEWVRGHAGHPQNEYANHLATRAAADQSDSGGLVDSGFVAWLERERELRQRYLDFFEAEPPPAAG